MLFRALALSSLLVSGTAFAQGSFVLYGAGCPGSGTGPSFCDSLNTNGALRTGTLPNEYCYAVRTGANPITVFGFRYFTQSTTSLDETMFTALYLDAGGTPSVTESALGSMTVGANFGAYESYIDPPVQIPANTTFWISQYESSLILASAVTSGTSPAAASYWRRPAGGGTAWAATGIITYPAWELICDSTTLGGTPTLANVGLPTQGQNFGLLLRFAFPSAPALLSIGASDQSWHGLPLPFDLTPLGAPSCFLLCSDEVQLGATVDSMGAASFQFQILSDPSVIGGGFFVQWLTLDPAHALPIASSNAGAGIIG